MKPRILITGNSHTAALKAGWESTPNCSVSVDFFVAPAGVYRQFSRDTEGNYGLIEDPDGDGLAETMATNLRTINGRLIRRLDDYTHVVLVGRRIGAKEVLEAGETCGVDEIRRQPEDSGTLLSWGCFDSFANYLADAFLPQKRLKQLAGTRLAVVPIPLAAETEARRSPDIRASLARRKAHPEGLKDLLAHHDTCLQRAFGNEGVRFIGQPEETITPYGTTALSFNRGSAHLREEAQHNDPYHMNKDYGRLLNELLLSWVKEPAPSTA